MPRYVAFLRGVSPMNARMAERKRAFERAAFIDVKTVRSSVAPFGGEGGVVEVDETFIGRKEGTVVRNAACRRVP